MAARAPSGYRRAMPTSSRALERIASTVENAGSLDPIIAPVQRLVGRLAKGRTKDLLSGVQIGHPLHPALVAVPLGALVGVSYLDLAGREPRAARRLLALGLVASGPAALTGLSDWSDTERAEKRLGAVHATTNLLGLALYASSWAARGKTPNAGRGRALGGLALLSCGGWLGGHLAYALGVGVDTTAFLAPIS